MRPAISVLLFFMIFSYSAAPQIKSVYTTTRVNSCRTIESTAEEAGYYLGECRGVGGYKVQLEEGDVRQTLNIITPSHKKFELDFWGLYSTFSWIGDKIEWRVKTGVPIALIARYNVTDPNDTDKNISILMVSKIGRRSSCVTDAVKAGPNQNAEARQLADVALGKPCMTGDQFMPVKN